MPIRYRCPACDQLLSISSRMAGQQMDCPTCGARTTVPLSESDVAASPADVPTGEPAPEALGFGEPQPAEEPTGGPEGSPANGSPPSVADEPTADAGGFQFRPRQPDTDEMDLTPMVDMTFLLLIFFMITASFSVQKSIEFPPPSPDQKGGAQVALTLDELEDNSVIVRIDDRNVVYIDDEPLADIARLPWALKSALTAQRNELVLTADDQALHETVVTVIDAAAAAGMQKIRLASQSRE